MSSTLSTDGALKFQIIVESDVLVLSRKIPPQVLDHIGFISWNRFCDRLDQCLDPLRKLMEEKTPDPGRKTEEAAKIGALQGLQETCDKLAEVYPSLRFTLYCPFHSSYAENWHIQASFAPGEQQPRSLNDLSDTPSADTTEGSSVGLQEGRQAQEDDALDHPNAQVSSEAEANSVQAPSFHKIAGNLGVHGKDYFLHIVQPEDTLQGICIQYNIELFRLKQANLLSGDNESLLLAPHKTLAIPISDGFYSRVQDTESKDYKVSALRKQFPKLSEKEAIAYLELADWGLHDALATAREDIEWEKDAKDDLF